ncbi:hypothetical protein LEP1GSC005_0086 [Leptospira santarosai str. ST188]|nr:hypothetical protein LEP1GSC005_0086 [Leptospira santarosai str. ST188]
MWFRNSRCAVFISEKQDPAKMTVSFLKLVYQIIFMYYFLFYFTKLPPKLFFAKS